jgi:hypothetical protein
LFENQAGSQTSPIKALFGSLCKNIVKKDVKNLKGNARITNSWRFCFLPGNILRLWDKF